MAQATIGALRVNLGIDSAQFSKGLKGAEKGLTLFGISTKKIAAGIAAGLTAVVGALTGVAAAMRGTINEADKLGKMAQQIGIPVEELSRLKHAADLSGVSIEGLSTSVGRLSRNMSDVAAGAGAEARRAFVALGISVTNADGTLKSSSQVMTEIAGKFAGMEDGAGKTALAYQLMGRSGATMIPLLNQGAAGLNAMMREADLLGIVIDTKTAKAAEAFNDNLTRLRGVFRGIITQMTAHLLPTLEQLSAQLVAAATGPDLMKSAADNLATAMKWVIDVGIRAIATLQGIRAEIAGLSEALSLLGDLDFSGARDAWNRGQQEFLQIQKGMKKSLHDLWSGKGDRLDVEEVSTRIAAPMLAAAAKTKKASAEIAKAARDAQRAQDAIMAEGQRVFEATRTPAEQLALEFERLNRLVQAGAVDWETYRRAVEQAQDAFARTSESRKALEDMGRTLQQSFSSMFDSAIDGAFKFKDAIAGLLKDLSRLLVNQAFQSILTGGPGGGGIFFGKLSGFAQGGSFKVGGSGGIDSQLVAFKASPNETVDVRKPGQDRGGGDTIAPQFHIDARGAQRGAAEEIIAAAERRILPQIVSVVREARSRRVLD